MPTIEYNGHLPKDLSRVWGQMNANKGDVEQRCEQYAMWTIPYLCPEEGSETTESRKGDVTMGSGLVNSLANRIVNVMFPLDRPFFALPLTPKANRALLAEVNGDKLKHGKALLEIRQVTEAVAEDAMRSLNPNLVPPYCSRGRKACNRHRRLYHTPPR